MTGAARAPESLQQRHGLKLFTVVIMAIVAMISVWLSHIPNAPWSSTYLIPPFCALYWYVITVNVAEVFHN